MLSQNAWFKWADATGAPPAHPLGEPLARRLRDRLAARGWRCSEPGNWRDAGWNVVCSRAAIELEVVVAQVAERGQAPPSWLVQIRPLRAPGLVGRLLGRAASAAPRDIDALAEDLHSVLVADGDVSGIRWRVDGFPDEARSTPTPTASV